MLTYMNNGRLKGFHMALENGLIVSVQWGMNNYITNRNLLGDYKDQPDNSPDCEVMVWFTDDNTKGIDLDTFEIIEPGQPKGWITTSDLIDLLAKLKSLQF